MQRTAIAFFLFAIVAPLCASDSTCDIALPLQTMPSRPASVPHEFARRLTVAGVPNLGEVTPTLYRGSQPTKEGFERLAKMRIAIVVDLRGNRKDERDALNILGMQYVPIPWFCMRPKDAVIAQFLNLVRENPGKKIFVHCNTGIDRTGMMIAGYRMAEQHWTAQDALKEMEVFGFSRFHKTICTGLTSYEESFPQKLGSDPVFQKLRASDHR